MKNEMGEACGTHGNKKNDTGLWVENLNKRDRLKDLDVDGRIILNWVLKQKDGRT
jgi:hypothetical protein